MPLNSKFYRVIVTTIQNKPIFTRDIENLSQLARFVILTENVRVNSFHKINVEVYSCGVATEPLLLEKFKADTNDNAIYNMICKAKGLSNA